MKYKHRILADRLVRLLDHFPIVVISGARQVGKSTLLAHELADWDRVVFDPAIDVGNARADPDLFLDNHPAPLILDEIQYAPELVAALKRRVDRTRASGQFVLTGSQQWSVLQSASESLAGRAVFLDLEGFSLREIAEHTGATAWLERYLTDPHAFVASPTERLDLPRPTFAQLWTGFLPAADALDPDVHSTFHEAYLRTYIERDVRLLSEVDDWQQFGRLVRLAAALTAQEIDYSQFGREIGVRPQTAQRWLAMLRATFQWHETPAYHGNAVKRLSKKPKGYLADTGLACALQMISTPQTLAGHPLVGALFETAVVAEIRKLSGALATPPALYHWRTHGGAEVDVVLERDGTLFPIEIKLTSKPVSGDARGLIAFRKTHPQQNVAPGLIICAAEQKQQISANDWSLPWDSL